MQALDGGREFDEKAIVSLTRRQLEVVTLLCEGLNTKQIARRLGVVPAVVSNHLLAVRKANGLKNVAQIGMAAERAGIASSRISS